MRIRPDDRFVEPWLTVSIKKCNQKSRKLNKKANNSGLESDYRKYKEYRNVLNKIKQSEKRKCYNELFQKIGKNAKLMWSVMNNLIKKTNNRHEIVELSYNGILHKDRHDICQAFNDHFPTVGNRVRSSISNKQDVVVSDLARKQKAVSNRLKFKRVTESEICRIVEKLKSKSSFGVDGVSNILLKRLISTIKGPLCVIFNRSISEGIFPDLMKLARIIHLDSGCLYRDCFMYFQPRISFQPRVVLNRESGIFGMWGDMKIVTA